jgi:hypothetical protein
MLRILLITTQQTNKQKQTNKQTNSDIRKPKYIGPNVRVCNSCSLPIVYIGFDSLDRQRHTSALDK